MLLVSEERQRRDTTLENLELITERSCCTVLEQISPEVPSDYSLCTQRCDRIPLCICPRYRKASSRAADSTLWMREEGHVVGGCSRGTAVRSPVFHVKTQRRLQIINRTR